jgi:hypothetical protein
MTNEIKEALQNLEDYEADLRNFGLSLKLQWAELDLDQSDNLEEDIRYISKAVQSSL